MAAKTLTIVFTDIKGFTERTSKSSREEMVRILRKHEELLKPIVLNHGGKVIKTIGDAFLLTFESPTNAVLCGVRMQATLRAYNATAPEAAQIDIRVSMNTGEVELIGDDVYGETVNLASRVEGITDAGEVYFTEATYLVMNKAEVPTSQVGEFRFKGIPEAVRIYRVIQDENLALYNAIVASQAVFDAVEPDAADLPEGAFSTRLLYTVEQQQALAARRRFDPIISAVATVLLLVLVGGGYWAYQAYDYRSRRSDAAQLIADGQAQRALDLLVALRAEKPSDPELHPLLEQAMTGDIQRLWTAGRFDEALNRIAEHRDRYPDLPVLDRLARDTCYHNAEAMLADFRDGQAARERLKEALERMLTDYPKDVEIRLLTARFYALHDNVGRGFFLLQQAAAVDPQAVSKQAWGVKGARRYLDHVYEEDSASLALIGDLYYDRVKPLLLERVGDPERKDARRNAYILLKQCQDLTPRDEFRFFTAELFYRTIIERRFREQTFAYFENLMANGLPPDLTDHLPAELPPARVLNPQAPDRERALPIISRFFPQALSH